MLFTDDIRKAILKLANEVGSDHFFYPSEVAKRMDPDNWAGLVDQVELVAKSLIQEGKILLTQTGTGTETAYKKHSH